MSLSGEPPAESQRVFIALPIAPEAVKQTEAVQAAVALQATHQTIGLRLTPPHQFHVTLAFLGEIALNRLERVVEAALEFARARAAFRLQASGLVVFPSARRARVLGLALDDPGGSLSAAVADLHTSLVREGFALEQRIFRPHITLARLRRPSSIDPMALKGSAAEAKYVCDTLTVYQSVLGAAGARYRVILACRLR